MGTTGVNAPQYGRGDSPLPGPRTTHGESGWPRPGTAGIYGPQYVGESGCLGLGCSSCLDIATQGKMGTEGSAANRRYLTDRTVNRDEVDPGPG